MGFNISQMKKNMKNELQVYIKWLNNHSINAENGLFIFPAFVIYSAGELIASTLLLRVTQRRRRLTDACNGIVTTGQMKNAVGHQTLSCAQSWISTRPV